RSISGNSCTRPEPRGHSTVNVLLTIAAASRSPARANTVSRLPLGWRTVPSGTGLPGGGGVPSSSVNSRTAAASGSSSGPCSPLGSDHAPSSLRAQNGPPMCPSSTSGPAGPGRCSRMPALYTTIPQTLPGVPQLLREQPGDLRGRHRRGEEPALPGVAAELLQVCELRRGLDRLGGDRQAQRVRQPDHQPDHLPVDLVGRRPARPVVTAAVAAG